MLALRRSISVGVAVAVLLSVGCDDPYAGRMEVSGAATLKTKPMPEGAIIQFEPLDSQGTAGMATFSGGKYQIPRQGGLKPGRYLVRLSAGDGKTAVNPVEPDKPPGPGGGTNVISKELVPDAWGRKSKQEVVVKAEGPNQFNFDIP